jgi:TolA protein
MPRRQAAASSTRALPRQSSASNSRWASAAAGSAPRPGRSRAGRSVAGFEYLLYLNQLQARLKQNWAWAGTDRNRKAVVRFGILETGEIVDVRITEASGDPTYDASVERAVRAANPMPPPPEAYRKQFSDVEYTFTPESMDM